MGTRIGPMYRQFEREAKRLRENGAGAEADKLDGQASQMRLNRTSNIAASGENQAERAGYAAGQAGLVESQRRSQLEQQRLDREAQAQTTRLTAAQAGALEAQNRGGTGTKPGVAPNSDLASTPRPSAGGAANDGSPFRNPAPFHTNSVGVSATQSPASTPRPSLAAQPRGGVTPEEKARIEALRGKTDAMLDANNPKSGVNSPGSMAALRTEAAGSRQTAIDAALEGAAGDTSATRGSVIGQINKERESKGLLPFGGDIYKDIAKAYAKASAESARPGREYDIDQRTLEIGQANAKTLAEASKAADEKLSKMTPYETMDLATQYRRKAEDENADFGSLAGASERRAEEDALTAQRRGEREKDLGFNTMLFKAENAQRSETKLRNTQLAEQKRKKGTKS